MHLNAPLTVALLFGAMASAAPAPASQDGAATTSATATLPTAASTDTAVASYQLDDLASFAAQQANSSVASTSSKNKRGACTLSNLAIRKEW
jgi:tyrosinase